MVWGILARGLATVASKLAPALATKLPRAAPAIARAAAKITAPALAPLQRVAAKVVARVPSRAVSTTMLAKVGITLPTKRVLPVAARPATALKAAVSKVAVGMVEKPFRTALPYVATAGMLGAVSGIGEKKAATAVGRGALVGEVLTKPTRAPAALGVGRPKMIGRQIGGQVLVPEPVIVRSWTTGTTDFAVDSTDQHWVLTRSGWKKYSPSKPIVLGTKHLTPRKFIAAAKKYYAMKKDLDKVFKTVKKRK